MVIMLVAILRFSGAPHAHLVYQLTSCADSRQLTQQSVREHPTPRWLLEDALSHWFTHTEFLSVCLLCLSHSIYLQCVLLYITSVFHSFFLSYSFSLLLHLSHSHNQTHKNTQPPLHPRASWLLKQSLVCLPKPHFQSEKQTNPTLMHDYIDYLSILILSKSTQTDATYLLYKQIFTHTYCT